MLESSSAKSMELAFSQWKLELSKSSTSERAERSFDEKTSTIGWLTFGSRYTKRSSKKQIRVSHYTLFGEREKERRKERRKKENRKKEK